MTEGTNVKALLELVLLYLYIWFNFWVCSTKTFSTHVEVICTTNEMKACFLYPAIIYHCDLTKEPLQPHIFREVTVKGFNPSDYQTTQVTTSSASHTYRLLGQEH